MSATIHNRGRGPEIEGTRITVYDVLAESESGLTPDEIARALQLSPEEVQAALDYLEAHREQVVAAWHQIQERHARGNSPEIQAKLEASHAKLLARQEELRRA